MNIEFKKTMMTPERAAALLQANTHNRRVSRTLVARLADDMRSGRWQFNGETIKMNGSRLLDGQHRLLACVESGVSFETVVCSGLPDETFHTIDTGRSRSVKDIMFIANAADSGRATALLQILFRIESADPLRRRARSAAVVLEKYESEQAYIAECLKFGRECWNSCRYIPITGWAAARWVLNRICPDRADAFLSSVAEANLLTPDSPRMSLRRTLETIYGGTGSRDTIILIAYVFKAWNLEVSGESVKRLTFQSSGPRSEKFPIPERPQL